jgi:shikimate kinase
MYLRTTEQTLFKRLLNDLKERPLIEGMGEKELRSFIEVKLNEREKTYNQAHLIFDEVQSIETIIQEILLLQRN